MGVHAGTPGEARDVAVGPAAVEEVGPVPTDGHLEKIRHGPTQRHGNAQTRDGPRISINRAGESRDGCDQTEQDEHAEEQERQVGTLWSVVNGYEYFGSVSGTRYRSNGSTSSKGGGVDEREDDGRIHRPCGRTVFICDIRLDGGAQARFGVPKGTFDCSLVPTQKGYSKLGRLTFCVESDPKS